MGMVKIRCGWLKTSRRGPMADLTRSRKGRAVLLFALAALQVLQVAPLPLLAREKKDITQYGMGLIVNVPFPENEVIQVVQEVIQNGIIRGTKEYNKDEYVSGANPESSTRVFPGWTEGGSVFYKVRLKAIDPRNFKDTNDVGTLAVRYVVQAQGEKNTVLTINAVFVEDFRHTVHQSNGSVESAEYKDIHDRLDAIASMQAETLEAEREKQGQGQSASKAITSAMEDAPAPASQPPAAITAGEMQNDAAQSAAPTALADVAPVQASEVSSAQNLQEQVRNLRQQVQRIVKAPGAALKSAPFHTASTLQSLPTGTEVLIVISTPYWLGVETHDGQHGWVMRDQLDVAP